MKTITINSLLSIILILLFSSCEKWKCVKGNNEIRIETRETGDFNGIKLKADNDYEVYVYIDTSLTSPIVKVTTDENLLPYVLTEVIDNDLIIETYDNRCLRSKLPITVDIMAPDMYLFEIQGSGLILCRGINRDRIHVIQEGTGKIEITGINAGFLNIENIGTGEIELDGIATRANMYNEGSGRIWAKYLELDICYVELIGDGSMYIQVKDELHVTIEGSGYVYYYFIEPFIRTWNGKGELIFLTHK